MKGQTLTNGEPKNEILELNETSEDQDTKEVLEKYLDELFSEEEKVDIQKEEVTPEIRFTRFLWKIKFIEQEIEKHEINIE